MNRLKTADHTSILNLFWAPLMTVLVSHSFLGPDYFSIFPLFAAASAIAIPVFYLLSHAQMQLSSLLRRRYPGFAQRRSRFAAWIFVSLPLTLAVIGGLWSVYSLLPFLKDKIQAGGLAWGILLGTIAHLFTIIVNEGQFTYEQWKVAILEAERLQKINLENRYEGLKQQVNPHFLFNSINTLSSLIHEDKKEAGRYIREMSQVYRYLLRNNDDELVPLQTELSFIQSYFHLLKTRFGNAVDLRVDVPPKAVHCLLPPLTLQMLVENAVKHNNASKTAPLVIAIEWRNEGWLAVKNNLQPKQGFVDSTGIGLNNISEKYKLLGLPDVSFLKKENLFVVQIPLVERHCG